MRRGSDKPRTLTPVEIEQIQVEDLARTRHINQGVPLEQALEDIRREREGRVHSSRLLKNLSNRTVL